MIAALERHRVPCSKVLSPAEFADQAHLVEREMIRTGRRPGRRPGHRARLPPGRSTASGPRAGAPHHCSASTTTPSSRDVLGFDDRRDRRPRGRRRAGQQAALTSGHPAIGRTRLLRRSVLTANLSGEGDPSSGGSHPPAGPKTRRAPSHPHPQARRPPCTSSRYRPGDEQPLPVRRPLPRQPGAARQRAAAARRSSPSSASWPRRRTRPGRRASARARCTAATTTTTTS